MNRNFSLFTSIFFALILAISLLFGGNIKTVRAEETTESADEDTAEASNSASTTENLKNRIEKIVDEKREQIKGVLSEIDQNKRGILGNVTRVSEESVTIKTTKSTEIIAIDDSVELLKAGKSVDLDEIAVNDWLVVMGSIDDGTFTPKRILVSSKSLRPPTPVVALGTIETIERSSLTISPRNGNSSFDITTSSKTTYQDINGEEIDREDIAEETQALVIGFEDEDNEKEARTIRILTVVDSGDDDE